MQIPQIIDQVEKECCGNCKVAKVLAELEKLNEPPAREPEEPPAQTGKRDSKPPRAAAPKPQKSGKVRRSRAQTKEDALAALTEFLRTHPGLSTKEIGKGMRLSAFSVRLQLKRLGKTVRHEGKTSTSRWYLAGKSAGSAETPSNPPSASADSKHGNFGRGQAPELKFKCDKCSAKFLTEKQLEDHNAQHHGGENNEPGKFECEECGKFFGSKEALEGHIRLRHSR